MPSPHNDHAEHFSRSVLPPHEEEHREEASGSPTRDNFVLDAWLVRVEGLVEEESEEAADGPGDEEVGVLGFGDVPLPGKVGDDRSEGACEAAEAEDNEAVENQVETAMALEHNL